MNRFKVKIILALIFFVQLAAHAEVPQLPEDWYTNPEDAESWAAPGFFPTLPWTKKAKMEKMVKSIYEVNRTAVENASEKQSFATPLNPIPNWTPWHLEAFTTELSVMSSGLIGVLTGKGTATAQAYWRKRERISGNTKPLIEEEANSLPTLNMDNVDDSKTLQTEIEPMVKSALATGKIKDETVFRRNMESAATEFFNMVNGIQDNPGSQWWVSGMRIEFSVSASGQLTPAVPVVSVGGDVRVRFDWRRLARKNTNRLLKTSNSSLSFLGFAGSRNKLQGKLQDLVNSLSDDLSMTFNEKFKTKGFKPYGFRLAIGFSASGNVGIAKSSAAAVASIAFSADASDPAKAVVKLASDTNPVLLIEKNPSEKHLQFAANNLIPYSLEANKTRAVYSLDRNNFRKGLRKAVKMANFFVTAGNNAGSKKWKLYQMKTGFEFSLTGTVGLVKYSGSSSAEMAFYNMNF